MGNWTEHQVVVASSSLVLAVVSAVVWVPQLLR